MFYVQKNADKVINQIEIENWDYCDIKTKAQLTLTLKNEPLSSIIYATTATCYDLKLKLRLYLGKDLKKYKGYDSSGKV